MRIVAHACSNTEIVCALGRADWLVGVDDHSDYPEDVVGRLPRVGPDLHVDVERIRALNPDLVIYSLTIPGHEKGLAELQAAGIPTLVCAPRTLADVYADVRRVADALGVPDRGRELADGMQSEIGEPRATDGPRVLVEWWPKPAIAAGRRSWVDGLLKCAGARNAHDRDVESAPIEDPSAFEADVIVVSWCGVPLSHYRVDKVLQRKGWENVQAVKNGRVFPITEAFLGRPGPRLVDGVRALRGIVGGFRD